MEKGSVNISKRSKILELLKIIFSGVGGVVLTLLVQQISPASQQINLNINGEEVTITEKDYSELLNEKENLEREALSAQEELQLKKEELATTQDKLEEANNELRETLDNVPVLEYSDIALNINGEVKNNFVKGYLEVEGRRFVSFDLINAIVNDDTDFSDSVLYIGHSKAEKVDLMKVCPPYDFSSSDLYDDKEPFQMMGETYNGLSARVHWSWEQYALVNLNNQYSNMEFLFGHVDGTGAWDCILNVYLDGEMVYSIEQRADADISFISIPLNYGKQLKLELKGKGDCRYGMGNIKLQY